jgi:hypothetical protein
MWWLSRGCSGLVGDVVAQLGDVMAQFRGCGVSEEDVVAQLRRYFYSDSVGDVMAQ